MIDEIELGTCTRCEDKVDASTLIELGSWQLCEICLGDI